MQHDYDVADAPGATVRGDINNVLEAIATNNSGATEPAALFANMWWFDTSTNILKQRTNANDAWDNVAFKDASGWVPYRLGTLVGDVATLTKDIDTALTANSDSRVATQKATKAYADSKISKTISGEIAAMTEKTNPAAADVLMIEDSAASNAKKKIQIGSLIPSGIQIFTSDGIFTVPAGKTKVYLTMVGGGAGGGGANNTTPAGGGGGGGEGIINFPYTVTPLSELTVTIGAGGNGGTNTNNDAQNGGDTVFDTITVSGGTKGQGGSAGGAGGAGGGAAKSTTGTAGSAPGSNAGGALYPFAGGTGGSQGSNYGGGGGGSIAGAGGASGASGQPGVAAADNSGGGGGGGSCNNASGGKGGSGIVMVIY